MYMHFHVIDKNMHKVRVQGPTNVHVCMLHAGETDHVHVHVHVLEFQCSLNTLSLVPRPYPMLHAEKRR